MRENQSSIAGKVIRDMIAHVTNDNLIGRKIKSRGAQKKNGRAALALSGYFSMTLLRWNISIWSGWN